MASGNLISDYTIVGTQPESTLSNLLGPVYAWTDGTPRASDAGNNKAANMNGAGGIGYTFSVPALTTPQTLTVYATGSCTVPSFTASINEANGTITDTSGFAFGGTTNTLRTFRTYTVTFAELTTGKTLTITYVTGPNPLAIGGCPGTSLSSSSVGLEAATVQ